MLQVDILDLTFRLVYAGGGHGVQGDGKKGVHRMLPKSAPTPS
ncbi:hypothetical protein [Methylobacterium sp. P1-11]|nr:hypothetical protein [Methylobacterium sp. P1-11]